MSKERFKVLDIVDAGRYRLVPDGELDAILASVPSSNQFIVSLPEGLTHGHLIRIFRTLRNMTLEDLEAQVGINKRQLVDIENDKCDPRKKTIGKLRSFFGSEFEIQSKKLLQD